MCGLCCLFAVQACGCLCESQIAQSYKGNTAACLCRLLSAVLLQLKKNEKLPPLPVWVVDLDTMSWTSLATTGDIPTARGGHTVSNTHFAQMPCCIAHAMQSLVFRAVGNPSRLDT